MRITQWGEYGIHCSLFLTAEHYAGRSAVTASDIAQAQGIALSYAQQILFRLKNGGVIESSRGAHGGYRLARAAAEITVHDILLAVEGHSLEILCDSKPIHPERCAEEMPCGLRTFWFEFREHVNDFLRNHTLESLYYRFGREELVLLPKVECLPKHS